MTGSSESSKTFAPEIVLIGASAGGVTAVREIIGGLERGFCLPVVIIQHLPPMARLSVDLIYGLKPWLPVLEVEDKMPIEPGKLYMAAPNYHVLIERERNFALSQEDRVHFSRPAIDVTFESAARAYGPGDLAVLLTGANQDGADGLAEIAEHGGVAVVQDPKEAECDVMPKAGIRRVKNARILRLGEITALLNQLARAGRQRDRAGELV